MVEMVVQLGHFKHMLCKGITTRPYWCTVCFMHCQKDACNAGFTLITMKLPLFVFFLCVYACVCVCHRVEYAPEGLLAKWMKHN